MSGICPCTVGNSVSKALFGLRDVKKLNCDAPEQTAVAVVLSRQVRHSNNMYHESPWQYLVSFRSKSGEEMQLQVAEEQYGELKEGSEWKLTWQEDKLLRFETA